MSILQLLKWILQLWKSQSCHSYALFINAGRAVETWAEFTKTRLRRHRKKDGVKQRACWTEEEMKKAWIHNTSRDVGKFSCISGASKSVFALHFKLINIPKGLGRWMSLKASAVLSIFAWKQTSPRKRPPSTKRPYQRHRKVGKSVPGKVFFCVFKAQLQQNTRSSKQ